MEGRSSPAQKRESTAIVPRYLLRRLPDQDPEPEVMVGHHYLDQAACLRRPHQPHHRWRSTGLRGPPGDLEVVHRRGYTVTQPNCQSPVPQFTSADFDGALRRRGVLVCTEHYEALY